LASRPRRFAAAGARVTLACRNDTNAEAAAEIIRERHGGAELDLVRIDTSDLDSVRAAAADVPDRIDRLYLLVNKAGVAWPPYALSPQGVEMQLATNSLGHFAVTGLLLVRLPTAGQLASWARATPGNNESLAWSSRAVGLR
jgi:NAD(P)-dependent dehydrogenase (short-subunit alcohol dehydrogenase family)